MVNALPLSDDVDFKEATFPLPPLTFFRNPDISLPTLSAIVELQNSISIPTNSLITYSTDFWLLTMAKA